MKHSQKVLFCENSSSWQWHGLKKFNLQFDLILRKLCSSSVASYGRWNVYRLKCLWANWVWQKILSVTETDVQIISPSQILGEVWLDMKKIQSKAWNNKKSWWETAREAEMVRRYVLTAAPITPDRSPKKVEGQAPASFTFRVIWGLRNWYTLKYSIKSGVFISNIQTTVDDILVYC